MLFSLALILLCALALSEIFRKIKLPRLLGMLLTGIILSPHALSLIAPEILNISADLRQIALVIILMRAGLSLDIEALKKVGRPAVLMCFVPATFEIAATTVIAPLLFGITHLEAAIMGTVLGAVSPAVIVPKMLMLSENGYSKGKSIPQLIMAGASVDDVYVIVLFTSFMGMANGGSSDFMSVAKIPVAVIVGLLAGIVSGMCLSWLFKKIRIRDTIKVLVVLSVAFLLVVSESYIPLSGLLAVMAVGAALLKGNEPIARRLSEKFAKLWVPAEVMLFVLVGATVNMDYAVEAGFTAVVLILAVLVFRFCGVLLCLVKTGLTVKERLFCGVAYMPKATVQAAIGGLPLAAGIGAGNTILTVAVMAILITAPLGAIGIDLLSGWLDTEINFP